MVVSDGDRQSGFPPPSSVFSNVIRRFACPRRSSTCAVERLLFVGMDGRGCRDANPARIDLRFERRNLQFTRVCGETTARTHVDDGGRATRDRGSAASVEWMARMRMEAMDTCGKTTCTSHETKDGKEVPVAFAHGFRPWTSIRRTMGQTAS